MKKINFSLVFALFMQCPITATALDADDENAIRSYASIYDAFSGNHMIEAVAVIDGVTFSRSANSVDNLVGLVRIFEDNTSADRMQWNEFQSIYNDSSAADAVVRFRGVPIQLSVARGSNTFVFRLPSAGIQQSFTGATRQESFDLLEQYIKENQDSLISAVLREAARLSASDPIAGNPTSLMAQMGAQDFADASGLTPSGGAPAQFGIGLDAETWKLGNVDQKIYRLPLSYAFSLENGYRLIVSAPLFHGESEGVDSYSAY